MGFIIGGSRNGSMIKEINRLQVVSLAINDTCNLRCRHCYLQTAQTHVSILGDREWLSLADSLFTYINPSVLAFVGKEPLLNSQSVKLISDVIQLRDKIQLSKHNQTNIGLLTNGMTLTQFSDVLLANPPDYLDISVDGLPAEHDLLRGSGAFSRLKPNLRWATKYFLNPLWLTPTLNRSNINSFLAMIDYYNSHFNIRRFAFGFYIPEDGIIGELSLLPEQVESLINKDLYELEKLEVNNPVEIFFDLYTLHPDVLQYFASAGWVPSGGGIEAFIYRFSNGITMRIHVTTVPVGLRYNVRITPEGYWLAAEDVFHTNAYEKLAVANVKDFHYDAIKLYEAGLQMSRLYKLNRHPILKSPGSSEFMRGRDVALV